MPFAYDLSYDSSIWSPVSSSGSHVWTPLTTSTGTTGTYWGWQGLSNSGTSYLSYSETYSSGSCGLQNDKTYYEYQFSGLVYYDQAGAHQTGNGGLYYDSSLCNGIGPPNGFQPPLPEPPIAATDGSGKTLYWTPSFTGSSVIISAYITTKSGTTINPPVVSNPPAQQGWYSATDTNGNQITSANGVYTDTLGQTALTVLGTEPSNTTLSYAPPAGGTVSYTVSYKAYTVRTNFGCSGVTEYNQPNTYLVDKITLPDTTHYQFSYEATGAFRET